MAYVSLGSESLFSEEAYQEYIKQKELENPIPNLKLKNEEENTLDVALLKETDFTKLPEGKEILEAIRNFK